MCMLDDGDGLVTVLHERQPKARIEHKCKECGRVIRVGEFYTVERYVFEHDMYPHKTCSHCMQIRHWLMRECGGFLYTGVVEDITQHVEEGYGWRVMFMAAGARKKWTRKDGRLWPLPKQPALSMEKG